MQIKIKIGQLIEAMAEFKNEPLVSNEEIAVDDLGCSIMTPTGVLTPINHIIKKNNLAGMKLEFENGHILKCAKKHILFNGGNDIYADDIKIGDNIDAIDGKLNVIGLCDINETEFYDIGVDAPHQYVDSIGIIHHNTIVTAALSHLVEQATNGGRTLVIVPNKDLVEQTAEDYRNVGLDVGVYYGDKKDIGTQHTICTWQSLTNLHKAGTIDGLNIIDAFIDGVQCVIVDEAHSAKATCLKDLLTGPLASIPIRWGMTGTIPEHHHQAILILMCIGETINELTTKELQDMGMLAKCRVNIIQIQDKGEYADYKNEQTYLLSNAARMKYIAEQIEDMAKEGNTLVLVDRIKAGELLDEFIDDASFISGSSKSSARNAEYDRISSGNNEIVIATYGIAAVGINIPRIFNLVLIEPGKSYIKVVQSIGRGVRKAKDKDHVEIWDFTSSAKYSKRHLTKRKAFYRKKEFPFEVTKVTI